MSDRPGMARIVPRASANVVITGRSGSTGLRHAASGLRAERVASTDPLADFAGPLVYDGYLDALRPADSLW